MKYRTSFQPSQTLKAKAQKKTENSPFFILKGICPAAQGVERPFVVTSDATTTRDANTQPSGPDSLDP
jgi:hypothetical protein